MGACGDAADAIYHQLAYEMVRPGIDQTAWLPVMQRMQTVDLKYLLPMILAFLIGCAALAIGAAKENIVSRANPLLYALAIGVALGGGMFDGYCEFAPGFVFGAQFGAFTTKLLSPANLLLTIGFPIAIPIHAIPLFDK